MHDFFKDTTKRFKWRAGNSDGKWRNIEVDELLRPRGPQQNYIWEVNTDWNDDDYDDMPFEVYTGFTVSADDYDKVWKLINSHTDLNDMDYDLASWKIKLVGVDLTNDGPRIMRSTFRGR